LGCTRVLRGIKRSNKEIEEIVLAEVLKGLDLDMDSFIDLCILVRNSDLILKEWV
jgi:hypothetical protein